MFHVKHSVVDPGFATALREALDTLPDAPTQEQIEALRVHWDLVKTWNRRVNLTAITDDTDAAWLHYRDSLEALSLLPEGPIVDLGSGAGYPGLPIAITQPFREVTLVEPRRKRASFLITVIAKLGLTNARVLETRSESEPDQLYSAAVTRATFSGRDGLTSCLRWIRPGGVLIAYRSGSMAEIDGSTSHTYAIHGEDRILQVIRS